MVNIDDEKVILFEQLNKIDNLDLLNKIEEIINTRKRKINKENSLYLNELIENSKDDFKNLSSKNIDDTISEMRGSYDLWSFIRH